VGLRCMRSAKTSGCSNWCATICGIWSNRSRRCKCCRLIWDPAWEVALGDGGANGIGVMVEDVLDESEVADGGGHENVGCAPREMRKRATSMPIRPVRRHVLRRGGFVVDISRVDVCPGVQKNGGYFDGGGEVKGSWAVAASGLDELRIRMPGARGRGPAC